MEAPETAMTARSPWPGVLRPMQPSVGEHGPAPSDYTFDADGPLCSDTACHATYFARDISRQLRELLRQQSALLSAQRRQLLVVSRMAWATDRTMIAAFAKHTAGVCFVLNKEQWLRSNDYALLHPLSLDELFFSQSIVPPSYAKVQPPRAVWCAGSINVEQAISFPRMHCKELVFCYRDAPSDELPAPAICPYMFWTGSYNLTISSRQSIESATAVWSTEIATFAYRQFLSVLAHSEPLPDAEHPNVAQHSSPALRIGE